jgi:RNA ligase (TIGR02306 family)
MSTHPVEVIPVILEPHPEADTLSIVRIYNWQVITKTADWNNIPLVGAYIPPDSLVDVTRPEFSWLKRTPEDEKPHRVRVIRLRGVLSQGLLLPAPEGAQIGDDVADQLGVRHYNPPTQEQLDARSGGAESTSAEAYTGPIMWMPPYEIKSMYRYASAFRQDELVLVTEKLHGENAKFMFDGTRMWAGTHNEWKKPGMGTPWIVLKENPWIEAFCSANPMQVLIGEIFGWVQALRYGALPGDFWFRAFDIFDGSSPSTSNYWDVDRLHSAVDSKNLVPDFGTMPFDFKALQFFAEGPTTIPVVGNTNKPDKKGKQPIPNIREGLVIRPMRERTDHKLGRVILKLVSNNYLEKVD